MNDDQLNGYEESHGNGAIIETNDGLVQCSTDHNSGDIDNPLISSRFSITYEAGKNGTHLSFAEGNECGHGEHDTEAIWPVICRALNIVSVKELVKVLSGPAYIREENISGCEDYEWDILKLEQASIGYLYRLWLMDSVIGGTKLNPTIVKDSLLWDIEPTSVVTNFEEMDDLFEGFA